MTAELKPLRRDEDIEAALAAAFGQAVALEAELSQAPAAPTPATAFEPDGRGVPAAMQTAMYGGDWGPVVQMDLR